EMLTGEVPFTAVSPVGVLRKHLTDPPVPPRQRAPEAEITEAAERLILRALAKDPADRIASMDELRTELAGCYGTISFRRDAHRMPAALAQGIARKKRRLTQEIDEWISREKAALAARVEGAGEAPAELEEEPLLLTDRKPI